MADLTFTQGAGPVLVVNDQSGNQMAVNSDGSLNQRMSDTSGNSVTVGQKTMANSLPIVIASDQTTVPVSTGLPFFLSKTFGYAVSINQPSSGSDNPLILIKNPNASGKTLYLSFISYGISVANTLGTIRVYSGPTITANGTSATVVSFGGGTTAVTVFTTPTISANGTLMSTTTLGQNTNSVLIPIGYEISVAANSNILITGNPGSNAKAAEISLRWIEI